MRLVVLVVAATLLGAGAAAAQLNPVPGALRDTSSVEPNGHRIIQQSIEIPASVADVWSAVTDPDRCARWFGRWSGDGRPGGTVELVLTSDEDGGGAPSTVLVRDCEPPHRLVVDIREGGGPWELSVTLTPDGGGTVLVFE